MLLRCISFGLETEVDDQSLLMKLAYCFYLPTSISGPLTLYSTFAANVSMVYLLRGHRLLHKNIHFLVISLQRIEMKTFQNPKIYFKNKIIELSVSFLCLFTP